MVAKPARKRRTGLIVSIVLVVVILLCGGVATTAYVVTNRQTGTGQSTPSVAATGFLTAVYLHQDAAAAAKFVCKAANDSNAIRKRVDDLTAATKKLSGPTYTWDTLDVSGQTKSVATVTTKLHLSTSDEKTSSQAISIITVQDHGWWVCDVKTSAN